MQLSINSNMSAPQFGMLKKSQLTPIQKEFSRRTKAPLEKMNSISDLEKFNENIFQKLLELTKLKGEGAQSSMKQWENMLNKIKMLTNDGDFWRTMIYESLQKTKTYIPVCVEHPTLMTLLKLHKSLKDTKSLLNFRKEYNKQLNLEARELFFDNNNLTKTGWIKFAPNSNKEENDKVVENIRIASSKTTWCTKSDLWARSVLLDGNFYIYYKDGFPTIGVRTGRPILGFGGNEELTYEIKNVANKPLRPSTCKAELDELTNRFGVKVYHNNMGMCD